MTGIFGILESSATQWYQDVAPTQKFFLIVTSIVYGHCPQIRGLNQGGDWKSSVHPKRVHEWSSSCRQYPSAGCLSLWNISRDPFRLLLVPKRKKKSASSTRSSSANCATADLHDSMVSSTICQFSTSFTSSTFPYLTFFRFTDPSTAVLDEDPVRGKVPLDPDDVDPLRVGHEESSNDQIVMVSCEKYVPGAVDYAMYVIITWIS